LQICYIILSSVYDSQCRKLHRGGENRTKSLVFGKAIFITSTIIVHIREVVSMQRFSIVLMSLVICLCLGSYVPQVFAGGDNAATAKKLTDMVKGPHNHLDYYTGNHEYINEEAAGPLEKAFIL